jgi:prepilin-type N-terminal cleavage/methylation domain-containing protein
MLFRGNRRGGEGAARFRTRLKPRVPHTGERGVTLLELLVVLAIVAIMVAVSFPALTAGLAGVRLASAAGTTASFLTSTMNTVERREQAAAIVIAPHENTIDVFTEASGEKPAKHLELPPGVTIEGDEPTRFALYPGGAFPRMRIVLRSEKGGRRSVEIDPVTAVPKIERL